MASSGGVVSAGPQATAAATKLKSFISNDLQGSLNNLNTLAANLENAPDWKGPAQQDYQSNTYPSIQKASKQMQSDLNQISAAVSKVLANILAAGGAK